MGLRDLGLSLSDSCSEIASNDLNLTLGFLLFGVLDFRGDHLGIVGISEHARRFGNAITEFLK